jgi:hypothetical protein
VLVHIRTTKAIPDIGGDFTEPYERSGGLMVTSIPVALSAT